MFFEFLSSQQESQPLLRVFWRCTSVALFHQLHAAVEMTLIAFQNRIIRMKKEGEAEIVLSNCTFTGYT